MAKYIFTRPNGPWQYPTLGITATLNDVIEANAAPDLWWELTDSGATVTLPAIPAIPGVVEPLDGAIGRWNRQTNEVEFVAQLPDENLPDRLQEAALASTIGSGADARIVADAANSGGAISAAAIARGMERFQQFTVGAKLGSRFALMGDSNGRAPYFLGNEGGDDPTVNRRGETWFSTLSVASGGRIRAALNVAISGNTTAQMLARFDADLGARSSEWDSVILGPMGSNDEGGVLGDTLSNVEAMIIKTLRLGKSVAAIVSKLPSSSHSNRVWGRKLNTGLQKLASKYGILYIDAYAYFLDPATADWRDHMDHLFADGQHLSLRGVNKLGKFAWSKLSSLVSDGQMFLAQDQIDTSLMRNSSTQPYNHLWLIDADASGMPDGFTIDGSAGSSTLTYAIDPTFDPDAKSIKITGTLSTTYANARRISLTLSNTSPNTGAWTPGDIVQVAVRIKYDPTTWPGDGRVFSSGVTFTDAGDLVNLTAHGASVGDQVVFGAITGTTGIEANTPYYVKTVPNANSLTLSTTSGGATIALTTDGSAASATFRSSSANVVVAGPTGATQRIEIELEATNGTPSSVFKQVLYGAHDGVVVSEPTAIPPGTTAFALRLRIIGGPLTVQFDRFSVRNGTVQGMVL